MGKTYHDRDAWEFVSDGAEHEVVGPEVVAPLCVERWVGGWVGE